MEHSRLLKFLTEPRYKTIMAEPPSIKVHKDYETPPNITAEVPGEQKIREVDSHYQESTEDIQEMKNGGHRISYTGEKTTAQTDRQTVTRTVSTTESRDVTQRPSTSEEKNPAAKKSRIPLVKFKQTVERVQNERQKNMKDQPHNKRRRSSIPKLKDAKAVKRRSSLKVEQKLDDEFEKLYEEVVDNKQSGVDDKILAINVDDPEKVETKFEEIIHAYDSNDDNYFTPSEKLKLSKIPWRKKDNSNKTGAVSKTKTTVTNSKLQDGGFKVSANTITTKRFSRGNSMDLSKSQKLDVVETSIEQNPTDNEVIKVTTATEIFGDNPEKTKTAIHVIKRATSLGETGGDHFKVRKIENVQDNYKEKMEIEEIENGRKITKTITRIPIKPERVNRSISRELNRRPANLDDRDFVNREVVKREEFIDGTSKTIIRETVIKEPQIRTEKITRSISRTFSRDGKSITLPSKNRQSYNEGNKSLSTEDNKSDKFNQTPSHDVIRISNQSALKDEKYTKDNTKLSTPVITKTTHSYIKGNIKNIERSKSVEWKAADEVITKKFSRTYSENKSTKHDIDDQKSEAMIEENKAILDDIKLTSLIKTQSDEFQSSVTENNEDKKCIQTSNDDEEPYHVLRDSTNISVSRDQEEFDTSLNSFKSSQETTNRTPSKSQNLPSQEGINNITDAALPNKNNNIQNVTILKGNVNRLITQLSVKDTDLSKKDIEAEKELPKEKSVLSKIAMFEGKGTEYTIKVKKCSLDKNPTTLSATDNIEKKKNSVDKIYLTQPELDYLNNNVYVPNGSYMDTEQISFNDGPVIVDQIMKYQEENISTIHQVQEVKILPEAIDFTVSESNVEIVESFPETNKFLSAEISVKSNQNYTEQIELLPEKIDFIHSEEQTEDSQMLTDKIKYETTKRQPDTTLSLPANINVIPRDNPNSIFKYSLEKNATANADKKAQKPKVGKLNLDLWNKQVQVNKQLVAKGKSTEPSQIKLQTITTTKVAYEKELIANEVPKKLESQSESITLRSDVNYTSDISKSEISILLPGQLKIKSEEHSEMPTILPFMREFKSNIKLNETPKLLPETLDFAANEGQLQVPVILPETPLTVSTKLKFESQKSHIEVPVPTSYITEFKTNIYTAETTNIIQNTNTSKVPKTMSEYNAEEHSIETPRTPDEINIVTDKTGFEKIKILPERIDFKTPGDEENITRQVPVGKFNLNPYVKVDQSNVKFPKLNNDIDLDKEIPSDPELVDSEPEIRDTKDTIMGKLKNKVFLITNRNANKNKATYYTEKSAGPTTPSSVDDYTNKTALYPVPNENTVSKDSLEITNDFNSTKNIDQNSMHDFNVEYESREDIKRTKSLAELDLGDAVKGQVQRMVYRIKSVDFDRIETSKARKISLREMPKKSSVLEKIALFEGKANSPTTPNPRPVDIATTSKNLTQPSNQSLTEEMYLRKIEDLSTVKMRYSKTDMLYLSLGNGDQMPAIALGTALLDPRLAAHVVSAAIDLGYRAIDTAFIYGTERLVGEGIKKKIDDGTVTRGELFIMGKLWSTFHKPELVETACRASLEALGLDYFDLYMIHNPMSLKEGGDPIPQIANVLQLSQYDYMDAWFAMEALVSKGLVKAIGVSNFNSQQIQKILDKGHIKPLVNQVECHPYLTQQPLQAFCRERNITLSCFSVLGSKGTPAEYKTAVAPAIDDPLVKVMASGLNKTPAQLLVRYQIQSGRQAVVKASSPGHLYDILQALTFVLEPHQIEAINALNRNKRIFDLKKLGELHKNYPFNVPF